MPERFTAPVGGQEMGITQGVNYVRGVDGRITVASGTNAPSAPSTPATPEAPTATPAPEAQPRELSPLEQFHPSLDPSKVDLTWDEQTGKLRVTTKAETVEAADDGGGGFPEFPETSAGLPGDSEPTAPTTSESALRDQVSQLTQIVGLMAQAQMSGRPLGEVLGLNTASAPSEPDYSQLDLYDPAQLGSFIKQQVQGAIQGAMAPHQGTIEQARRRQEYDGVALKHGADPAFNNKVIAALQLVKENPSLTIDQGYDIVNRIAQQIAPSAAPGATQPNGHAAASAKPATRTITQEQAQQKADQAKRLPSDSGVRGAGRPPLPSQINSLGQIMAWVAQQESLGH